MDAREQALLKKIHIRTGRKLNTLFVGEYHSAFKGYGLAFDSVREYQYGDDFRNVDWNVTARMNHLFIKEYIEERELSIVLMIEPSASTEFGSGRTKRDLVLELAALFLYLAQMNNDRVSVVLFTDTVEKYLRPRKGRRFILKILDEIIRCKPKSRGTDIGAAVDFVRRVTKKRSVIFVISDFLDRNAGYLPRLRYLRERHDVIPVQVCDPLEREPRFFGLVEFLDLESGRSFLSDALPEKGNVPLLREFDPVIVNTDEPAEVPLLRFFEKRNRRRLVSRA